MTKKEQALNLSGIFPPIPTPFDDAENLALDHLGENLERWGQLPLAGYVVGGSNGEFVSLTGEERLAVLRYVRQRVGSDRLVIAGSGLHATRETIQQTQAMAGVGADAALVITPSYYKARMDTQALSAHFQRVADHSPIPVILYNVPANTGIDMSADMIIALSKHGNIIGLKDSAGNVTKLAEVLLGAKSGFQVLAGSAGFFLAALAVGAVGTISALANVSGKVLASLLDAFNAGDLRQAREIQQRLVRPNAAVTSRFGVAGLKYALSLAGYYGGPTRSPLQALHSEQQREVEAVFSEAGLI